VNDGEQVRMAYMDVAPAQPNGRTVVLLHGRNFPSSYWAPVIKTLSDAGYRVVVPDQIGFGKSSKPLADLHFDTLARNTIALLDHLGVAKGRYRGAFARAACWACGSRAPIRTGSRIWY
jgi:pimeloyl-ACP methyl ester carboxylesterase